MVIAEVIPIRPPNADAISLLEEWLDMARSGELLDVAMIGSLREGVMMTAYHASEDRYAQLGALEVLKARMLAQIHGAG